MDCCNWRQIQRQNFRSLSALCDFLELESAQRQNLLKRPPFPLNLPMRLAKKIEKGRLDDPILLQFVPSTEEMADREAFTENPVGDQQARKSGKLLRKYADRSLLLTTGACAMHCRFCFRKHFPYSKERKSFEPELKIIQEDHSLEEIILSGGDPLSLSNGELATLLQRLDQFMHVKRIRFHSRFPIGIPERIDAGLLEILGGVRSQIWFVIHCNHPRELDGDVIGAMKMLQRLGIPLLNQSVLLKGVNDELGVLESLSRELVNAGIQPYYLHQLDRVAGASHFEVDIKKGGELIAELNQRLAGYAVPKYVREETARPSKVLLHSLD
jgi:EF-P beta-lysylation protein EpmB